MIEFMPDTQDNAVAFKVSGKLAHEDYRDVLIPGLEEQILHHGNLNVLALFEENFDGWDLEAAWDDASFGLTHRSDFNNIAMVGGPAWVRWGVKLCAFLIKGDVRFFDSGQRADALAWING